MADPPLLRQSRRLQGEDPPEPESLRPREPTEPDPMVEDVSASELDQSEYHTTDAEYLFPNQTIPESIIIQDNTHYQQNQPVQQHDTTTVTSTHNQTNNDNNTVSSHNQENQRNILSNHNNSSNSIHSSLNPPEGRAPSSSMIQDFRTQIQATTYLSQIEWDPHIPTTTNQFHYCQAKTNH